MSVTIFTRSSPCAYCEAAKKLLTEHGIKYTEIVADADDDTKRLFRSKVPAEVKTVPQIFLNEKWIGGYEDLSTKIFEIVGEENITAHYHD